VVEERSDDTTGFHHPVSPTPIGVAAKRWFNCCDPYRGRWLKSHRVPAVSLRSTAG
jgi:hypothetical protein